MLFYPLDWLVVLIVSDNYCKLNNKGINLVKFAKLKFENSIGHNGFMGKTQKVFFGGCLQKQAPVVVSEDNTEKLRRSWIIFGFFPLMFCK